MSDSPDGPSSGPRQHLVEVGVAAFMALLGIIAIVGSLRVGTGWGAEGPKSGFFPFWIGLIVVATSLYNMVRAIAGTLMNVGRGYWPVEKVEEILTAEDRKSAGPTAPAHGLFLMRVTYPEGIEKSDE